MGLGKRYCGRNPELAIDLMGKGDLCIKYCILCVCLWTPWNPGWFSGSLFEELYMVHCSKEGEVKGLVVG